MSYQLIHEAIHTARKIHTCIWCGESIEPGDSYRREWSKYDGESQKHTWHIECDGAAKKYFDDEGGEASFSPYDNERPEKP